MISAKKNGRILIVRLWTSSWQRIHENPANRRPKISETTRTPGSEATQNGIHGVSRRNIVISPTNVRVEPSRMGDITWFNMVWKVLEYPVEACQKVLSLNYFMFILIFFVLLNIGVPQNHCFPCHDQCWTSWVPTSQWRHHRCWVATGSIPICPIELNSGWWICIVQTGSSQE